LAGHCAMTCIMAI
jgi:hypothetical protein